MEEGEKKRETAWKRKGRGMIRREKKRRNNERKSRIRKGGKELGREGRRGET